MKEIIVIVILIIFCFASVGGYDFDGKGTKNSPFIISTKEDLLTLSNEVNNEKKNFKDCWFRQENDIDMQNIEFIPIGIFGSGSYFEGVYDGNGKKITNLNISRSDNSGFFGALGGGCINLGIESGTISGACVGAISSHSSSDKAFIINCYNKATVKGDRAGGIVDNFNGTVINCFSDCEVIGRQFGGISSYDVLTVYGCISTRNPFPYGNDVLKKCQTIAYSNSKKIVGKLNLQSFFLNDFNVSFRDLNGWIINNGEIEHSNDKQTFSFLFFLANWVYVFFIVMFFSVVVIILRGIDFKEKR